MVILSAVLVPAWILSPENEAQDNTAAPRPAPRAGVPASSQEASPGSSTPRYSIEAEYVESPRALSGRQTLRYVNNEGESLGSLKFHLWTNEKTFTEIGGGTKISSVKINGKKARFSVEGTVLDVELPQPLQSGATASVEMEFETAIPEIAAPFGYSSGVISLGVWHPVLALHTEDGWNLPPPTEFGEPYFAESADYEVRLTLPEGLTSVATGVTVDRRSSGTNGKQTMTYRAQHVRDFALAIGEELERVSRKTGKTTVNVYYRPGSAPRAEQALDLASRSLAYFSDIYGTYPYAELDVVDAPLVAGTEYSTLTFANLDAADEYVFSSVIPHEVAHQWWYVQVGSAQFDAPWLDESLATYSEWLFSGDAATRFPDPVTPDPPLHSPVDAFPDNATYQQVVYLHGAQLYRDLSTRIGEETLLRGLQDYVEKHRYKTATAGDLVDSLSGAAGKDLSSFFAEYGIRAQRPPQQ